MTHKHRNGARRLFWGRVTLRLTGTSDRRGGGPGSPAHPH